MEDIIGNSLGVAPHTPEKIEVVPHSETDYNAKLREFKEMALVNASLDTEEARQNMRLLITKGMSALDDVLDAVKTTQDPKSIMAASSYMQALSQINASMVKLNSDALKLSTAKQEPQTQQPIEANQTNIECESVIMVDSSKILSDARKLKSWETAENE